MKNIIVPRWFLEVVEDTLRIQNNINLEKETGETCQDRNIKQSLNGVRKLLNGEELTGMERLEKLQPSLPANLDDVKLDISDIVDCGYKGIAEFFYNRGKRDGAKWMARQG